MMVGGTISWARVLDSKKRDKEVATLVAALIHVCVLTACNGSSRLPSLLLSLPTVMYSITLTSFPLKLLLPIVLSQQHEQQKK